MDHVWEANASASPPPAPASPLIGYPSETGSPTQPGAWWFHMITEEIRNAIIAGGGTPAFGTLNQLASVINSKAGFLDAQENNYAISAAGGTSDAITGSYTPAIAVATNGMSLMVRAGSANATTTPTFTPNAGVIAAHTIVKGNNLPLVAGDIAGAGHWIELQWDATLSAWVLLNPATGTATVTATNDASFVDNSAKAASTSWVCGLFSPVTVSLGANVPLNNTASYFDGPSVAQGTVGKWFVSGTITLDDSAAAPTIFVKLWDGATVIASCALDMLGANKTASASLSGFIIAPTGNLRMSAKSNSATSLIFSNGSGNTKDCTITALRIG